MIQLGDKVKDRISGLVGTVVSKTEYLNGCIQYAVQAKYDKKATEIPSWNIDEEQLIVVEPKKSKKKEKNGGATFKTIYSRRVI